MALNFIREKYYNFVEGVKKLYYWIPVIWKDKDFDYTYFHEIMLHKLKSMEDFFKNDAYSMDAQRDAENIARAISILERMIDDNYLEEAMIPFYEKYPDYKVKIEFEPVEGSNCLSRLVDNDTEEQKALKRKCYIQEDILRREDYSKFYYLLKNCIREWWD